GRRCAGRLERIAGEEGAAPPDVFGELTKFLENRGLLLFGPLFLHLLFAVDEEQVTHGRSLLSPSSRTRALQSTPALAIYTHELRPRRQRPSHCRGGGLPHRPGDEARGLRAPRCAGEL